MSLACDTIQTTKESISEDQSPLRGAGRPRVETGARRGWRQEWGQTVGGEKMEKMTKDY